MTRQIVTTIKTDIDCKEIRCEFTLVRCIYKSGKVSWQVWSKCGQGRKTVQGFETRRDANLFLQTILF